jgi:hypothetical protein
MSDEKPAVRAGNSASQRGMRMTLALLAIGLGWALILAPVFGMVTSGVLVAATFIAGIGLLLVGSKAFKMVFFD